MKSFFTMCLLFCVLVFTGCKKSTTPITTTLMSLTAEYVGVTETELHLQVDSSQPYDALQLLRDGQLMLSAPFSTTDTTLLDTTLLPSHTYTYQTVLLYNSRQSSKSNEITLTTMDTTSHNFQWEIFTFESPYGSAALYDVAIIDENDIWAVGEIYADSSQPWLPYNAVHWNGNNWQKRRIYVDYQGQPTLVPLEGVFVLQDGEVVFSSGLPYLPENNGWVLYHLWDMGVLSQDDGSISSIWGTSLNNIYFAGNKGTIVHYDGNNWRKIETGTELDFRDIWGVKVNNETDWEVIAVASKKWVNQERLILKISPTFEIISDEDINNSLVALWFLQNLKYYVAGSGIYEKKNLSESKWNNQPLDITNYYINGIRGININDVVAVGGFGEVLHFNGMNWKSYFSITNLDGTYYSVEMKKDFVVTVGYSSPKAVILMGKRE